MRDKDTTPPDHTHVLRQGIDNQGEYSVCECGYKHYHTNLSELREELKAAHNRFHGRFDTHGEVAVHAQWTPQELENVQIKDEELFYDEISALFKQYAQPPVVADEQLDEILDDLYLDAWGAGRKAERNQTGIRTVTPNFKDAKAALLQREQRLVAEARVDELERITGFSAAGGIYTKAGVDTSAAWVPISINDRIAGLQSTINEDKSNE